MSLDLDMLGFKKGTKTREIVEHLLSQGFSATSGRYVRQGDLYRFIEDHQAVTEVDFLKTVEARVKSKGTRPSTKDKNLRWNLLVLVGIQRSAIGEPWDGRTAWRVSEVEAQAVWADDVDDGYYFFPDEIGQVLRYKRSADTILWLTSDQGIKRAVSLSTRRARKVMCAFEDDETLAKALHEARKRDFFGTIRQIY